MIIFPAIDICNGAAVRLVRGDYNQKTVYSESPEKVAMSFVKAGCTHLHAVDLDGAKSGKTDNYTVVKHLIESSGLNVEIGGGVRNEETIQQYLDVGVWRVILGTIAVKDPDFTARMISKYGNAVAVGADMQDGIIRVNGWLEDGGIDCDTFCRQMSDMGCSAMICTDISRDGMLEGTNLELYAHLKQSFPQMRFTASGGISTIHDIERLKEIQMDAAIIGKAYYEGRIDLAEALEVAS